MAQEEELQRLLAAESKADQIIKSAELRSTELIAQAKRDAQAAQRKQAEHSADILASFLSQAEQRAAQAITERRRHYAERSERMKATAERAKAQALDAAVVLLIGAETIPP